MQHGDGKAPIVGFRMPSTPEQPQSADSFRPVEYTNPLQVTHRGIQKMHPLDIQRVIKDLREHGYTRSAIAQKLNLSSPTVLTYERLGNLTPEARQKLEKQKRFRVGVAKELARLPHDLQSVVLHQYELEALSLSEIKNIVDPLVTNETTVHLATTRTKTKQNALKQRCEQATNVAQGLVVLIETMAQLGETLPGIHTPEGEYLDFELTSAIRKLQYIRDEIRRKE